MRALVLACALLAGCSARDIRSPAPQASAPAAPAPREVAQPSSGGECRAVVVGTLPGPIDGLAVSSSSVFTASRSRGEVSMLALDASGAGAPPRVIAAAEREPFALIVRGGELAWASLEGVVGSGAGGANRRLLLASESVAALTAGPVGLYAAVRDPDAIWRIDWPGSGGAAVVVRDAGAEELVADASFLAWISRPDSIIAYDLATGHRRVLSEGQRKPHDLSAHGGSLTWHEGEAELLPGRDAEAFTADLRTGAVDRAPGEYESFNQYFARGAHVYGAGVCKGSHQVAFRRLGSGEAERPVADDARRWYWVQDLHDGRHQIVAADKSACCP